jgi:hypothetical protein
MVLGTSRFGVHRSPAPKKLRRAAFPPVQWTVPGAPRLRRGGRALIRRIKKKVIGVVFSHSFLFSLTRLLNSVVLLPAPTKVLAYTWALEPISCTYLETIARTQVDTGKKVNLNGHFRLVDACDLCRSFARLVLLRLECPRRDESRYILTTRYIM